MAGVTVVTDGSMEAQGHGQPLDPGSLARPSIRFITLLRGIAAWFVVWDHLVAIWLDRHGQTWPPLTLVRQNLTMPLGIIQDFGFLGVALFFLISGFIISYVAQRESRLVFALKRVFRIYPPLIVSILLTLGIAGLQPWLGVQHLSLPNLSWGQVLQCMTLVNYFQVNQDPISGVAWTLVIELLFYLLCCLGLPWLKRRPVAFSLITSGLCTGAIALARQFGPNFFLLAAAIAYLPYLLLGQAIYFRWSGKISPGQWAGLSAVAYGVLIYGIRTIHTAFYPTSNSYGVSLMLAYGIFIICLLLEKHLKLPNWSIFSAQISYSLYLNHGLIGGVLLDWWVPKVGYSLGLAIALPLVIAACYLSWLWVEQPSQQLCRRWIQQWQLQ